MRYQLLNSFLFFALFVLTMNPCQIQAQDYRIYTRVSHQDAGSEEKPRVIARSLTIWHAGKVYDYMDSVGELVIYDPAQKRYTLVSGPHRKACTVEFGELRNFLNVARSKSKEYLIELQDSNLPGAMQEAESIRFQLDPTFIIEFDEDKQVLTGTSPQMKYEVECVVAPDPEISSAFRHYTDWAAQLNYVLHGMSLMPGPRMQINKHLNDRSLLPVKVKLSLNDEFGTRYIAEHSVQWQLGEIDLTQVSQWKNQLQDENMQFVSFQDYQRALLKQYAGR